MSNNDRYGAVFSVRLNTDMAEQVHDLMKKQGLSKNDLLTKIISSYLAEHEEQPLFDHYDLDAIM